MKKYVSAFILGASVLSASISVQAGQTTVVVAPNSIQSAEDGFTFKSTEGKEYFVYHNTDNKVKGVEFLSKKKNTVCLTTNSDDSITAISNGQCTVSTSSQQPIPKQVIKAATGYANSIACNVELKPNNIITLVPHKTNDDIMESKYAALWSGDIGCDGGTGTVTTNISIVGVGAFDTYVVNPSQSSPVIEFGLPVQALSKIISNTKNSIVLEANEAAETDPTCCPSIPVRFTLTSDVKNNWIVADKKYLKK
jgi:hypothetical protein